MSRPHEAKRLHTRLLKCTLELENSRIYWGLAGSGGALTAEQAFEEGWFGHRSLNRLQELLGDLRVRFDAFPSALQVLHGWKEMASDTQRLICHWHLQLADPLYRHFSGRRRSTREILPPIGCRLPVSAGRSAPKSISGVKLLEHHTGVDIAELRVGAEMPPVRVPTI